MSEKKYKAEDLVRYATALLEKAGLESEKSQVVAEILLEGDLLGHNAEAQRTRRSQRKAKKLGVVLEFAGCRANNRPAGNERKDVTFPSWFPLPPLRSLRLCVGF